MATRVVTRDEMPADAGLSVLGILMRLGGAWGLWLGLSGLIVVLFGGATLGTVALVGLGIGRSVLHRAAGRALAASRPGHVRLAWLYVGLGAVHTVALVAFADLLPDGLQGLVNVIGALLASWPIVVTGLLSRPSTRAVCAAMASGRRRIFAEDLGMTGVAALMSALGTVGCVMVLLWMLTMLQADILKAGMLGWISLMVGAGFLVRALLHARNGIRFLRRFNPRVFRSGNDQYFLASALTTGVVCVLMLFASLSGLAAILLIFPVAGLLMAWPALVRDVGTIELNPDLEEDDSPSIRPARDRGLVMLGMVLLTYGAFGLTGLLALYGMDLPQLAGEASPSLGLPGTSVAMSVASSVITVWAGIELVGMTSRHKIAAIVNLVTVIIVSGIAAYAMFQVLDNESNSPLGGRGRMLEIQAAGQAVLGLFLPIAIPLVTAIQVLRKPDQGEIDVEEVF